ncbi:hypothetical protein BKP35_01475 [Anaerobacillus arseniciselenatis]|uniref:Uncharacterized protein n=1 Tax=Anaerobacillus arseniciselenatis TaxID=85682 RepID=A0A1S2LT46_9BACI|nr:hypothetical protein [Anaerobacillus arseniciselenatis]OIJ15691.1 hypothetical protein BKP35_01475 [Anaerobacillus arseniciselenatis]
MKPEKEQIDEMINEGLGAGKIDDYKDKKQLENPISKKQGDEQREKDKTLNTMATDLEDVKKLGKEMENMKTNKKVKKEGMTPDPIQE